MAGIKALAVHTSDFRRSRKVRYYRLTNQQLQGDLQWLRLLMADPLSTVLDRYTLLGTRQDKRRLVRIIPEADPQLGKW